jgi:DNA ligase (NAD+)
MKRSQAEVKVKALGGSPKASVVKGLSYLVANDTESGSAKNKKARDFGVPVIDEKRFLELIGKAMRSVSGVAAPAPPPAQGELF